MEKEKKYTSEVPSVYLRNRNGTRFRREQVLNSMILFNFLSPFTFLYEIMYICVYLHVCEHKCTECTCMSLYWRVGPRLMSRKHHSSVIPLFIGTVSQSVQSIPISLVLLASLFWGSLSPPSRTGITGSLSPTVHLHGFWTVVHMLAQQQSHLPYPKSCIS